MHHVRTWSIVAALSAALVACSSDPLKSDSTVDAGKDGAAADLLPAHLPADLVTADAPAGCSGDLRPPIAGAIFGESPHVAGMHVLMLTDAIAPQCGDLGGVPSCSCTAPCTCFTLQFTIPPNLKPGVYPMTQLAGQYTVGTNDANGSGSNTYNVSAGLLDVLAVDGQGLSAGVCGIEARGLGPVSLSGRFAASACL